MEVVNDFDKISVEKINFVFQKIVIHFLLHALLGFRRQWSLGQNHYYAVIRKREMTVLGQGSVCETWSNDVLWKLKRRICWM